MALRGLLELLKSPPGQKLVLIVLSFAQVRNDVCKYLQDIAIALYVVSDEKLAHPDRVLCPCTNQVGRGL